MILNIIYLKNSLIRHGNPSKRRGGRVYEALLPKFEGVYKIFLLHTSCCNCNLNGTAKLYNCHLVDSTLEQCCDHGINHCNLE
jgi:hypothetical protein